MSLNVVIDHKGSGSLRYVAVTIERASRLATSYAEVQVTDPTTGPYGFVRQLPPNDSFQARSRR
jgi:hypothetical protein